MTKKPLRTRGVGEKRDGASLEEVAETLGVSPTRVRQIEQMALRKLGRKKEMRALLALSQSKDIGGLGRCGSETNLDNQRGDFDSVGRSDLRLRRQTKAASGDGAEAGRVRSGGSGHSGNAFGDALPIQRRLGQPVERIDALKPEKRFEPVSDGQWLATKPERALVNDDIRAAMKAMAADASLQSVRVKLGEKQYGKTQHDAHRIARQFDISITTKTSGEWLYIRRVLVS